MIISFPIHYGRGLGFDHAAQTTQTPTRDNLECAIVSHFEFFKSVWYHYPLVTVSVQSTSHTENYCAYHRELKPRITDWC
jgi:hypothetical protein